MGNSISSLNNIFCRGAHGAICIADITNQKSLEDCVEWKNQLDQCVQLKNGDPLPMLLVVNKCDLVGDVKEQDLEEHMQSEYLQQFAGENEFIGISRVSAKSGENVNFAWS